MSLCRTPLSDGRYVLNFVAMRIPVLAILISLFASASVPAATVDANLLIPCPCEFPYLVDNANGVNYEPFIFEVPNYAAVGQINGLTLRFQVYDDAVSDRQESFKLVLDIPGQNVEVLRFTDNLGSLIGAIDPSTAHLVEHTLTPDELGAILPSLGITNGLFLIRLNRLEGDFYVREAGATLDVQYVPEPGTAWLMAAPVLLAVAALRRRR
jgi:hypothetical protein